ncbi:MAG: hypothetical protein ACYSOO_07755 [Planctomycetota bacterium]|jgi:hypothetical protein
MKVVDWLLDLKLLAWLTVTERKIESDLNDTNIVRRDLDRRVDDITKATLNGEEEWFLQLVRKDPDCALDVITSCGLKPNNEESK